MNRARATAAAGALRRKGPPSPLGSGRANSPSRLRAGRPRLARCAWALRADRRSTERAGGAEAALMLGGADGERSTLSALDRRRNR